MSDLLMAHMMTVDPEGFGGTCAWFWGPPSAAKTAAVEAAAHEIGLPLLWISPLGTGEAKFGVVPSIATVGGHERLVFPSPRDMDVFSYELGADGLPDYSKPLWEDGIPRGVLFLDEANARPDLQASIMSITAKRRWGDHFMGTGVRVILAANPTSQSAGGYEPPEPMMSRVGHYDIDPVSHGAWSGWGDAKFNGNTLPEMRKPIGRRDTSKYLAHEKRMKAELAPFMGQAWGEVKAFTGDFPKHFNLTPENTDVVKARARAKTCRGKYALATVRTWSYAVSTLASARWQGFDQTTQLEVVASYVGLDTAVEFFAYVGRMWLPDAVEIMQGKATYAHDKGKPDRTRAVVRSVVAAMAATPTTAAGMELIKRGWAVLNQLRKEAGDDMVCGYIEPLISAGMYNGPRWGPDSREFLQAAGELANNG